MTGREGICARSRVAGREVRSGLGPVEGKLREVHIVDIIDGVGDLHIGDGREPGRVSLIRGGGGTEIEAHRLGLGVNQPGREGDAPDAIFQERGVEEGGVEGAVDIATALPVVKLDGLGELTLFGKEHLGGVGRFKRLAVLPVELADWRGGEFDILTGPRSNRAGGIVVHAQIVDVDVGVVIGFQACRHHHQPQRTVLPVSANNLGPIELGHNARHRPSATGVLELHGRRDIPPRRIGAREEVGVRSGTIEILQHHIRRGELSVAAKLVVLGNAILKADRAVTRLGIR